MTTISVPLSKQHEERLDTLVKQGVGANRADVMRKGLDKLAEDEAIATILNALKEPTLKGDLGTLARKMRGK
jgi:Arc/MetJ-type ribon-helix-helix transcriptional regulator